MFCYLLNSSQGKRLVVCYPLQRIDFKKVSCCGVNHTTDLVHTILS